jgi:hypothetical protein
MKKRNLFFIIATAVLLITTACEGSFVDPGMQDSGGGLYGSGGSLGGSLGGGSGGGGLGDILGGGSGGGGYGGGGYGGGTFTLTDIPTRYEGMYAGFAVINYSVSEGWLCAYQSYNKYTDKNTLCRISGGSVTMPMWNGYKGEKRFSGNISNVVVSVKIFDSPTTDSPSYTGFHGYVGSSMLFLVDFRNGSAAKSWNDEI